MNNLKVIVAGSRTYGNTHFLEYVLDFKKNFFFNFKELVWEETCKKDWWECQTPFAMMNIFFHEEDLGTHYFVLRIGRDQKFKLGSIEACKEKAQSWFEEQLTQFIETSENPAQ